MRAEAFVTAAALLLLIAVVVAALVPHLQAVLRLPMP